MDRILVVEDDRELNQGICFALQQAGYETESAYSTQEAKLAGLQQEYSLMILDANLRGLVPGRHGVHSSRPALRV